MTRDDFLKALDAIDQRGTNRREILHEFTGMSGSLERWNDVDRTKMGLAVGLIQQRRQDEANQLSHLLAKTKV